MIPAGSLQHIYISVVEKFKIKSGKNNKILQPVSYNDPTASLLHVQGNAMIHLSMLFAAITILYVLNPKEDLLSTARCREYKDELEGLIIEAIVAHSICAFCLLTGRFLDFF